MTARTLIYSEMRKEVNMAHIFMMFIGKFVLSLVILALLAVHEYAKQQSA